MFYLLVCAPLIFVSHTLLWSSLFSLWKYVPHHMEDLPSLSSHIYWYQGKHCLQLS